MTVVRTCSQHNIAFSAHYIKFRCPTSRSSTSS